ncbi:MAG: F0F1 ATP synthase subunit B [Clostridiales bacterium]|nr:F0F1 ATP synthase subunit B [Clostridiales bacterium]
MQWLKVLSVDTQSLEVISVNLWQILISLCNLLLLFLIIKRFLYKPVKKVLAQRQAALQEQYDAAASAQTDAEENRSKWEQKLHGAQEEADNLLKKATAAADRRGEQIVSEAKEKAEGIIRQAEDQAELERKKAAAGIKKEIADVSAALTEKMIGRELREEDHRAIIDSFIQEIGEDDDGNK